MQQRAHVRLLTTYTHAKCSGAQRHTLKGPGDVSWVGLG